MKKYRMKEPPAIYAEQFQWKEGSGIPDIAGVKFASWRLVDTGYGIKNVPDYLTAYIEAGVGGRIPVNRGDWVIRQGDKITLCADGYFQSTYEEVV